MRDQTAPAPAKPFPPGILEAVCPPIRAAWLDLHCLGRGV